MKSLLLGIVCSAGLIVAQTPATHTDSTTTTTQSKKHGKHVKTDSVSQSATTEPDGSTTTDTSKTTMKAKKHHGKVKTESSTTKSTTTTPPQP